MARVLLENICKTYPGGVKAVDNVDLEIHDREFVVRVGPSGCGKSTILRMIAGLEEVTSGNVSINGKQVNEVPPKDRDIAMVFQNYALYPHCQGEVIAPEVGNRPTPNRGFNLVPKKTSVYADDTWD